MRRCSMTVVLDDAVERVLLDAQAPVHRGPMSVEAAGRLGTPAGRPAG
jgi:hypothetical protein